MRLGLRTKLIASFAIIIILNTILGGVIYTNVNNTTSNVKDIVESTTSAAQSIKTLRADFIDLLEAQSNEKAVVDNISPIMKDPERFHDLQNTWSTDPQASQDLIIEIAPIFSVMNENENAIQNAQDRLQEVADLTDENLLKLGDETKVMADNNKLMMILFNIIAAIVAVALALALAALIVTPVRRLTATANSIGEGFVDTPMPEINSKDEVKDLAASIEAMRWTIKFLKKG